MIAEVKETNYRRAFRDLQIRSAAAPLAGWLDRLREGAIDRFEALGFPTTDNEEWKYTNVSAIARADFDPIATANTASVGNAVDPQRFRYPEARESTLVFVNGTLRTDLSTLSGLPTSVIATGINQALNQPELAELVREHLGRGVDFEANGFTALNTAFLTDGALVVIPRNVELVAPLQLLFLSDHAESAAIFPRVLVVCEEHSRATLIESYGTIGRGPYLTNAVVEIVIEDGARLEHYRIQNEGADAFHVTTTAADLGRQSSFATTSIALGARLSRHDVRVVMDHEGAECRVDGLYIVGSDQHADTHSVIDHRQPRCSSHQLYKGILDGKSRAVFNGKIFVRPGAMGTDAMQTNKNLLLSPEAHVDTKPQLEILADDVKCAHGAAIGQLDEDELFYLESRGIHNDLARNLLTYGFAEEVIARIGIESIKAQLDEAVLHRLHARLEA